MRTRSKNNVVLYKVEKRQAHRSAGQGEGRTYGKKAQVPSGQWSTLRVVATGPRFEVYLNGDEAVRSRRHDLYAAR